MNIKKRDRDLEWLSANRDLENPERLKSKQSSNLVFIGSVSIIGIVAALYVQLMNQNLMITRQINEHQEYITNKSNIETYEWHLLLQERNLSLRNYKAGAEQFLEELKNTKRICEEDFHFYETALKESTSFRSIITGFSADYNEIQINGIVPEENMPRLFAEYLTNLKDEEGKPKFAHVSYNGFSQVETVGYNFSVSVLLWEPLK